MRGGFYAKDMYHSALNVCISFRGDAFSCSEEQLSHSDDEFRRRAEHAFHYDSGDEDEGFEFDDEQDYASLFDCADGEEPETFNHAFDSCL